MSKISPQIVLFQEDEKALNYRYKQQYPIGPDILVKSREYDYDEFAKTNKLIGPRVDNSTMYFLHPYKNNVYISEKSDEDYFLKEKLELYKTIASNLGVKSISTKISFEKTGYIETDINGEAKYIEVSIEFEKKEKIENKYKKYLEINDTFIQLENFDLNKNIKELRKFIDDYNLHHELDLISLINARDSSQSGTILTDRTIKSEITSEYKSLLEVSAKLNSPVFSVSGSYKKKLEEVNRLNIDIELIF